jgi:hypothetical protein
MLRTELEVGKTYTYNTGGKYSRGELVRLDSLEPQRSRDSWKVSASLVLVSHNGERPKKVLLKDLYPEGDYYAEQETRERKAKARELTEQREEELLELLNTRRDEINALFGISRQFLRTDYKGNLVLTITLAEVKALLEKAAK